MFLSLLRLQFDTGETSKTSYICGLFFLFKWRVKIVAVSFNMLTFFILKSRFYPRIIKLPLLSMVYPEYTGCRVNIQLVSAKALCRKHSIPRTESHWCAYGEKADLLVSVFFESGINTIQIYFLSFKWIIASHSLYDSHVTRKGWWWWKRWGGLTRGRLVT